MTLRLLAARPHGLRLTWLREFKQRLLRAARLARQKSALPSSVGAALDGISNSMQTFMARPVLTPNDASADVAQIAAKLTAGGVTAASEGAPHAAAAAAAAAGTLSGAHGTLTSAWSAASPLPGGQPAAIQAYTEGTKAAAAAAAAATLSAMAGVADLHLCPIPTPVPPHEPGFVTKGSSTVVINNLPAARQGDQVMEACGGADPISMGCTTVDIGG